MTARGAGVSTGGKRSAKPQRRDARREEAGSGIPAPVASARLTRPLARSRARLAFACCVALLLIVLGSTVLWPRSHLPPPLVVAINQSNGPVQVFPGFGGVLLILPDGSLWRWGKVGPAGFARAAFPERMGTNCDWLLAAAGYNHPVGLRRDGTLWEWGRHSANGSQPVGPRTEPHQVGSSHDWVAVAAAAGHSSALRRDGTLWAWGDNNVNQLGNGPGPNQSTPVQVGTNSDWAAVCCPLNCTLALRRDGTLWAWGPVYVAASGPAMMNNLTLPTQICVESNWAGFSTGGFLPLVRARSGELWEPFHAAPSPTARAASMFRLVASNTVPGRFAAAWCGEPRFYEVRSDGTLWGRAQAFGPLSATPTGPWFRVGKRSDWTGLWGASGTALGMTSDGTLWTWGIDPGREPAPDFLSRLKMAQRRFASLLGPGPRPILGGAAPVYQKQPRPLIRLVLTNTVPPTRRSGAGAR